MRAPHTERSLTASLACSSSAGATRARDSYHEDKTHGDVQFPIAHYTNSADFEEPFGPDIAPHWHEEAEFIFVRQGKAKVTVAVASLPVEAGSVLFVQPAVLHSLVPILKDLVWHSFVFDLDFALGPIIGLSRHKYLPVLHSQVHPESLILRASSEGPPPPGTVLLS